MLRRQAMTDKLTQTYKQSMVSSRPNRVRDICDENMAQGWIFEDGTFASGHQRPPYHPNCHCYLITKEV